MPEPYVRFPGNRRPDVTPWKTLAARASAATSEALFSNFGKATERGVLTVNVSGGDLLVSWQPSAIGATLETTADLTPPATWANVSGSSTTNEFSNTPGCALSPVLEERADAALVRRQSR
jgi:hypothetical protein